jgi:hypothetical protein
LLTMSSVLTWKAGHLLQELTLKSLRLQMYSQPSRGPSHCSQHRYSFTKLGMEHTDFESDPWKYVCCVKKISSYNFVYL